MFLCFISHWYYFLFPHFANLIFTLLSSYSLPILFSIFAKSLIFLRIFLYILSIFLPSHFFLSLSTSRYSYSTSLPLLPDACTSSNYLWFLLSIIINTLSSSPSLYFSSFIFISISLSLPFYLSSFTALFFLVSLPFSHFHLSFACLWLDIHLLSWLLFPLPSTPAILVLFSHYLSCLFSSSSFSFLLSLPRYRVTIENRKYCIRLILTKLKF